MTHCGDLISINSLIAPATSYTTLPHLQCGVPSSVISLVIFSPKDLSFCYHQSTDGSHSNLCPIFLCVYFLSAAEHSHIKNDSSQNWGKGMCEKKGIIVDQSNQHVTGGYKHLKKYSMSAGPSTGWTFLETGRKRWWRLCFQRRCCWSYCLPPLRVCHGSWLLWLSGVSAGSIPSQGTCLGRGPGPQIGVCERQPMGVSLPLFLPPFCPL